MRLINTLQSFFKHLLMIDVYEEASVDDKEFSFLMFVNGNIVKYLL